MYSNYDASTPNDASQQEAAPKQSNPELDPELESLKITLSQLSEELIGVNISKLEPKNKIAYLEKHQLLKPEFAQNLEKWPEELKQYFINEFLVSVQVVGGGYDSNELSAINSFLETALYGEPCEDGRIPKDLWEQAMKSVARQLRDYYGLEDNEEELPCWRR